MPVYEATLLQLTTREASLAASGRPFRNNCLAFSRLCPVHWLGSMCSLLAFQLTTFSAGGYNDVVGIAANRQALFILWPA